MHFFHQSKFTSVENLRFSLHLSFIQLGITSNFNMINPIKVSKVMSFERNTQNVI